MSLVGKLDILLIAKTVLMEAGLKRASASVGRFESGLSKTNKQLLNLGAASVGIHAVTRGLRAAVAASDEFNKSLNQSLAIINNLTTAQEAQLRLAAQTASFGKRASAPEAAKGLFFLESAGFSPEAAAAALPSSIDFAQAGGGMFDLSTAIDLLTDAQSALGLASKDTETNLRNLVEVSDALVGANTLANATVEQFSRALTNKAAAAARGLGKDMNETLAVLAAFADQGLKGEAAGTALTIVWRDLQTKSIENEQAFKNMGVAVFDAAGEMRHTADIVNDLENALDGMSDRLQKQTLLTAGFSDKSIAYTQLLLDMGDGIREFNKSMDDMAGKTEEVSGRMQTEFEKLKTSWGDLIGFISRNTIGKAIEGGAESVNENFETLRAGLSLLGAISDEFRKGAADFVQPTLGKSKASDPGFEKQSLAVAGVRQFSLEMIKLGTILGDEGVSGIATETLENLEKLVRAPAISSLDDLGNIINETGIGLDNVSSEAQAATQEIDNLGESIGDALSEMSFEDIAESLSLDNVINSWRTLHNEIDKVNGSIGKSQFDLFRDRVGELRFAGLGESSSSNLLSDIDRAERRQGEFDAGKAADKLSEDFQKRMEGVPEAGRQLTKDREEAQDRFAQQFDTAKETFDRTVADLLQRRIEGQDPETIRRALVEAVEDRNTRVARDTKQPDGVAAITQGTQAAFALETQKTSIDKQLLTAAEEGNAIAQEQLDALERQPIFTPAPIGGPP